MSGSKSLNADGHEAFASGSKTHFQLGRSPSDGGDVADIEGGGEVSPV